MESVRPGRSSRPGRSIVPHPDKPHSRGDRHPIPTAPASFAEARRGLFAFESSDLTKFTDFGLAEPILTALQAAGYETPIDIGAEDKGEWWPYAYSPMLQSAGGDLIDRDTMLTADGELDDGERPGLGTAAGTAAH